MALRKAVYGLGASGRLWWQTFTQKNKDFGMTSITSDDCVFSIRQGGSVLIAAIVVDDVLMIGNDESLRQEWYAFMHGFFETGYLEQVLKRYCMDKCKYTASLMPQKFEIDADKLPERGTDQDIEEMRSILGSLQYLQLWTRPEISFSVNYLAQYTLRTDKSTIAAARWILRYLAGTKEKGIRFQYNPSTQL
eukprot:2148696-Rhodomonas_salina.1